MVYRVTAPLLPQTRPILHCYSPGFAFLLRCRILCTSCCSPRRWLPQIMSPFRYFVGRQTCVSWINSSVESKHYQLRWMLKQAEYLLKKFSDVSTTAVFSFRTLQYSSSKKTTAVVEMSLSFVSKYPACFVIVRRALVSALPGCWRL